MDRTGQILKAWESAAGMEEDKSHLAKFIHFFACGRGRVYKQWQEGRGKGVHDREEIDWHRLALVQR